MSDLTAKVLQLHDSGATPAYIAYLLSITQHRVESILDREAEAAGPLREQVQAPGIEPLRGDVQTEPPKVRGPRGRPSGYYTHGTQYGYKAHKKAGEDPCAACLAAMRAQWKHIREYRRIAVAS